jgi:hypothetical protein
MNFLTAAGQPSRLPEDWLAIARLDRLAAREAPDLRREIVQMALQYGVAAVTALLDRPPRRRAA